ncbi:hypothetical protein DIPPA_13901 [Diplonema papillatum]|nr:hypothetical protein DIPPA_13901 [Diplonema papillatum]
MAPSLKKRGEGRPSIGAERSRLLGQAEKGLIKDKKRKREDEVEAPPLKKEALEVVNAEGGTETLAMTWQQLLRNDVPVTMDTSSGIDMHCYINNVCLSHYPEEDINGKGMKAIISLKYSSSRVDDGKPKTMQLVTLTPKAPHTVLKGIRFHTTDQVQIVCHIVNSTAPEKVKVTACGEQVMNLTEQQVAALLL